VGVQYVREIADIDRVNVPGKQPLSGVFHCRIPAVIPLP
jgi:hypothetical protein